jgi:hypothetical protein
MKFFSNTAHVLPIALRRGILLSAVLCFFAVLIVNVQDRDDAFLRLKGFGLSKAAPVRAGGSAKVKADPPLAAAVEAPTLAPLSPAGTTLRCTETSGLAVSLSPAPHAGRAPPSFS